MTARGGKINMAFFTDTIRGERDYASISETLRAELSPLSKPLPMLVSGLCTGAAYAFYAAVAEDTKKYSGKTTLILVSDEGEGRRIAGFLSSVGLDACFYPQRELIFHDITASRDTEHERIYALSRLLSQSTPDVVVTTPDAAVSYTIAGGALSLHTVTLRVGEETPEAELSRRLCDAGYSRVDMVEGTGQYSVRGDIVDVYPPACASPIRIEFFGEEINRLCDFSPDTQRMSDPTDSAVILPAREFSAGADERAAIAEAARRLAAKAKSENVRGVLRGEAEAAEAGLPMMFADKYLQYLIGEKTCLLDYIDGRCTVITVEINNVNSRLEGYLAILDEEVKAMLEEGAISPEMADYSYRGDKLSVFEDKNAHIICSAFSSAGLSGRRTAGVYGFSSRRGVAYNGNISLLTEDIITAVRGGYRICVMCASQSSASLTAAAINDEGLTAVVSESVSPKLMKPAAAYVTWGVDTEGYELPTQKFTLLSFTQEHDAARKKRRARDRRRETNTQRIMSYGDLSVGDYIVHAAYGIGQYLGIENLVVDGAARDYVKIRYAGTDLLYLPTDQLDMVSKYIGAHADDADGGVKLSKMGGADWIKAKSRAKSAAKDMAKELIALYAARRRAKGFMLQQRLRSCLLDGQSRGIPL